MRTILNSHDPIGEREQRLFMVLKDMHDNGLAVSPNTYAIFIHAYLLFKLPDRAAEVLKEAQSVFAVVGTLTMDQLQDEFSRRISDSNPDWMDQFLLRKTYKIRNCLIKNEIGSGTVMKQMQYFAKKRTTLLLCYDFFRVRKEIDIISKVRRIMGIQVTEVKLQALLQTPVELLVDDEGVPLDACLTDWFSRAKEMVVTEIVESKETDDNVELIEF